MHTLHTHASYSRGVTVMLVLVFMGIFVLILGGLSGYIFSESKIGRSTLAREKALQVAEAGLEYYRWYLAHNPGNLTNGTGQAGPYVQSVRDAEGKTVGEYALTVNGNLSCGELQSIDIESEGRAASDPALTRTVSARYAKPSVAEYAYIINDSVWAGADRVITGPYHANGGIRMDGTNNSTVSSSVETWTCTSSFGCTPNQQQPGIFGAGSGSAYWEYPVPNVDFVGLTSDFSALKRLAQTGGVYIGPNKNDQRGYHIVLRSDNTFDLYNVLNTSAAQSIHVDNLGVWQTDYDTITREQWRGNYAIPSDCSLIFVEGKVWLEGVVSSKVAIVAAHLATDYAPDVLLNGDISYTAIDGSVGLTVIAERNVRFPLRVPDAMTVRGVFIAQSGYYGRNLYPCQYAPYDKRTSLSVIGTVVSNERVGTRWTYSTGQCGSNWSGFSTRTDSYDKMLAQTPPPFTPSFSVDAEFVLWKEE